MRHARLFAAIGVVAVNSCGRYADFTLPVPDGRQTAVSARWEVRPRPVLAPGAPGEWDGVDALNPSILFRNGEYWNLYSGYDGKTWHTGIAVSGNGIDWTKRGRVLSPDPALGEGSNMAANGSALDIGGEIFYWYQAGAPPWIGLARSRDGKSWSRHEGAVLTPGPRGSWDERGVADPYVIRAGDWLYLYYLGQDRARRQRLGVARSRDGTQWEKLRTNPVLELGGGGSFDEEGLGEPAVWVSHGRYWMLYTGRDRKEFRRLGLAWSRDGTHWQRYSENAVLAGEHTWNAKVVCDPSVEITPAGIRVWFGGGDVAHPVENIHGHIGVASLFLEEK